MKVRRNLSGIYFRSKNEETGKFDNVVFEDLTETEQDKYLENQTVNWYKSMIKKLSNTINEIGEFTDIAKP